MNMDPAFQNSKEKHILLKTCQVGTNLQNLYTKFDPMYCSYIVEFYEVCNLIERDDFIHS